MIYIYIYKIHIYGQLTLKTGQLVSSTRWFSRKGEMDSLTPSFKIIILFSFAVIKVWLK